MQTNFSLSVKIKIKFLPFFSPTVMNVKLRSTLLRYGLALVIFIITISIALLLSYYSFKINLTILIVIALVTASRYGGRGPGIFLAVLLQGTTVLTEQIPPDSSIIKASFGYLSVFLLLVFIVWLVSERKQFEMGLNSSLKELADIKFALDESAIVAITDLQGKITYVNDFFCEISKYSREELIGTARNFIDLEYHGKEFREDLLKTIRSGEIWRGEVRNLAKDNSIYWADTTIVPLLDDKGNPHQFVTIRYDITDRKIAEEKY